MREEIGEKWRGRGGRGRERREGEEGEGGRMNVFEDRKWE